MSDIQVKDLTSETTVTTSDLYMLQKSGTNEYRKVTGANILPDSSVVTAKINNSAVTTAKINNGAVTSLKLTNSYGFRAYANSAWTPGHNTFAKVPFNAESYDIGSNFDSTTNYRYTVPVTGYYQINVRVGFYTVSGAGITLSLYINGGATQSLGGSGVPVGYTGAFPTALQLNDTIHLTASDYLEVYCYGNSSNTGITGSAATYFSGYFIGA